MLSYLSSESQNFRPSMHAHLHCGPFSKIWILSSHSTQGSNAGIAQRYLTDTSGKIHIGPWSDTDTTCSQVVIYPFQSSSAVLGPDGPCVHYPTSTAPISASQMSVEQTSDVCCSPINSNSHLFISPGGLKPLRFG